MKIFLPRWILWILVPVLALIWGIITYVTMLFGGLALAEKGFPVLREPALAVSK